MRITKTMRKSIGSPIHRAFSTVRLSLGDWLLCSVVASSVLWLRELRGLRRAAVGSLEDLESFAFFRKSGVGPVYRRCTTGSNTASSS
jgi:hypothetical protein